MKNEAQFVAVAMHSWTSSLDRANHILSKLSPEQFLLPMSPGKNRPLYVLGHLTAYHDGMRSLLGLGPRLHSELDSLFITNPDSLLRQPPTAASLFPAWTAINESLADGLPRITLSEWLDKHSAVTEEEFTANPRRNRFAILLSRTAHLTYHSGQLALLGT